MSKFSLRDIKVKEKNLIIEGELGKNITFLSGNDLIISNFGLKILSRSSYYFFSNMLKKNIKHINEGFYIEIEFNGLGYRFINLKDRILLRLGYSHYIYYELPINIILLGFRRNLIIYSINKESVIRISNILKKIKRVNVYKFKGIFNKNEVVKLKSVKLSKK